MKLFKEILNLSMAICLIVIYFFSIAKICNAEYITDGKNLKTGDNVICTFFYESVENDSSNESMRIVTKIQGILKKRIGNECHIQVEGVSVLSYKKKWFVWLPDNSSFKPPPVKVGDIFMCKPQSEKYQKRSSSVVRSYTAIRNLSLP